MGRQLAMNSVRGVPALVRSHWFQDSSLPTVQAARLEGRISADIAIIGGGYVGLWTALSIKAQQPTIKVVILEQDVCGGGASGRNGGFAMSWWPKISTLIKLCGTDGARRLALASEQAVHQLGRFCEEHGIDAHFTQGGWLWTATNEAQRDAWAGTIEACKRLGHTPFVELPAAVVARRTGSPFHHSGVYEASNATVQPARLVAGLRKVAIAQGIVIHENTCVQKLSTQSPAVLTTEAGEVTAKAVVIANNVWAASIPELRRMITPVNSSIVVTEPIPERLREIGWTGGECITDSQLLVGFYSTTRDGRIAYGKGTGAIEFGAKISEIFSHDAPALRLAESDFRRAYPQLVDVPLATGWTGPVDRTYDSMPVFGRLQSADHIFYGIGWSGNGVAPSQLGGKILSALALGLRNEWSESGLVERPACKFPPEPIRYVGGNAVRNAVIRKERAEAMGQRPRWIDLRLAKFAPSGLEDKS
ncbi:MAG: FAD-dependent oxidoreductase [Alcaligenaceae bacterium]|nr:FAD-dependent oxidoreductase [Alcaligenaceae bacterium]